MTQKNLLAVMLELDPENLHDLNTVASVNNVNIESYRALERDGYIDYEWQVHANLCYTFHPTHQPERRNVFFPFAKLTPKGRKKAEEDKLKFKKADTVRKKKAHQEKSKVFWEGIHTAKFKVITIIIGLLLTIGGIAIATKFYGWW